MKESGKPLLIKVLSGIISNAGRLVSFSRKQLFLVLLLAASFSAVSFAQGHTQKNAQGNAQKQEAPQTISEDELRKPKPGQWGWGTSHKVNTLKVLFTGDLHSCAEQWPRLAAFINQERTKAQQEGYFVVTLDAGDIAMGTIYSALFEIDAYEYRALALMGYDAYVFGNHDFDVGATSLAYMFYNAHILGHNLNPLTGAKLRFPYNVTANIGAGDNKNLANALQFIGHSKYVILNRGGFKIGVFGLLGKDAYGVSAVKGQLQFSDPVETAKGIVAELKGKGADFIIAISHSGAMLKEKSEDYALAMACPDIDLIISGHDHIALFQPYMVNNVPIVAAGTGGRLLGEADLHKFNDTVKLADYSLKTVPSDIQPDRAMTLLTDSLRYKIGRYFYKYYRMSPEDIIALGHEGFEYQLAPKGFYPLAYEVAKSAYYYVANESGVELDTARLVSLVPAGVIRTSLPKDTVRFADAFSVLPLGRNKNKTLGYSLVVCSVKGKDLKRICEINTSVASSMPDSYLTFYGLSYTFNSKGMRYRRVKKVTVHGRPVQDQETYYVTTDSYTLSNLELMSEKSHGILKVTPLSSLELDKAEWAAFADYILAEASGSQVPCESYSPPADIPSNSWKWGIAGIVAAILALLGVLGWLIGKRRKGRLA